MTKILICKPENHFQTTKFSKQLFEFKNYLRCIRLGLALPNIWYIGGWGGNSVIDEFVSHWIVTDVFGDQAGGGDFGIVGLKLKDDGLRLKACASS